MKINIISLYHPYFLVFVRISFWLMTLHMFDFLFRDLGIKLASFFLLCISYWSSFILQVIQHELSPGVIVYSIFPDTMILSAVPCRL